SESRHWLRRDGRPPPSGRAKLGSHHHHICQGLQIMCKPRALFLRMFWFVSGHGFTDCGKTGAWVQHRGRPVLQARDTRSESVTALAAVPEEVSHLSVLRTFLIPLVLIG